MDLPYEPRHVHLRDADARRHLRLRHAFEEAQMEDQPLARIEPLHGRSQHPALLEDLVRLFFGAQAVEQLQRFVFVVGPPPEKMETEL